MIIQGDCLEKLKELADESVDCCITSPPYWGLRDYGTAEWEGGDEKCKHKVGRFTTPHSSKQGSNAGSGDKQAQGLCPHCGAKRVDDQLGLEKTPEEYVEKMVKVFAEVKRVLKKEGTVWLNLGDSYASTGKEGGDIDLDTGMDINRGRGRLNRHNLIKPKDLIGIPWRVAFALQADGWYLRQDIIWHKPNPMPESVADRCTKSHEYVFLLTKSPKYYFDNDAIKEPAVYPNDNRGARPDSRRGTGYNSMNGVTGEFRNKRDVWTVNTKPYAEAHFAVYPEKLIAPMVKAGCPEGGVVLDPFFGAGTTGLVAQKLKRKWIGIELNPEYIKIAEDRLKQPILL